MRIKRVSRVSLRLLELGPCLVGYECSPLSGGGTGSSAGSGQNAVLPGPVYSLLAQTVECSWK